MVLVTKSETRLDVLRSDPAPTTKLKGQLISEQIYAVLNFPKIQRNIARISALACKKGQIKKVKAHYHPD